MFLKQFVGLVGLRARHRLEGELAVVHQLQAKRRANGTCCLGFRVWGLGFRVSGLGFRLGFRVQGWFRV